MNHPSALNLAITCSTSPHLTNQNYGELEDTQILHIQHVRLVSIYGTIQLARSLTIHSHARFYRALREIPSRTNS